jgi:Lysyl-tRNA synthetase (class II)
MLVLLSLTTTLLIWSFICRIATELHLKRMIIGGMERVYEIGRIFRNEGISTRHNPEFTMLEMYCAYGDYNQLMDFTEEMLRYIAQNVLGTADFVYQGKEISFAKPFRRLRMADAIKEVTGLDVSTLKTIEEARAAAKELGVPLDKEDSRGHVINAIFEAKVEHTLIAPTFLMDHPVEISPLTKVHRTNAGEVERFELFVYGRELANGYSELSDPQDQRARLEEQAKKKRPAMMKLCPSTWTLSWLWNTACRPPWVSASVSTDWLCCSLIRPASAMSSPFPQ